MTAEAVWVGLTVTATRTQYTSPLVTYKTSSNSDESFILRNDRIGWMNISLFYRNIFKTENIIPYVFNKTFPTADDKMRL